MLKVGEKAPSLFEGRPHIEGGERRAWHRKLAEGGALRGQGFQVPTITCQLSTGETSALLLHWLWRQRDGDGQLDIDVRR
jgi:hypothetical protein